MQWYEKESLYSENTNCPICGKDLSKRSIQLIGVGVFMNIFTCSIKCQKELIRQIWKLSKQKDKQSKRRIRKNNSCLMCIEEIP